MRVLVTGGTGVVGTAAVAELRRRGHSVRLLSRHASEDVERWPDGVEPYDGSVTDPASLRGAADGCDAVLHMVAVVAESPPEVTFENTNVEGTRNVVAEAERAGVRRFVYVSSLGADRGQSPYHKSKRAGELVALASSMNTTVARLANVYGPGDQVVSLLIKTIRVLPVVPTIDGGNDEFQPVWVGDAACALAECVVREDLAGRTLDIAGPDRTCMNDLIERVRGITGRSPLTVPVPGSIAVFGARLAGLAGIDIPLDSGQVTMLEEGNVIHDDQVNALTDVLHVEPTALATGLSQLADALPEQMPDSGVGTMHRRLVWADIVGSSMTPEQLFERFRKRFSEITPGTMDVAPEPGTSDEPEPGETLTMALPARGNVQVRVEDLGPRSMTLVTLQGHPLAGGVRFLCERRGEALRFEVQVYERAADVADWLAMRAVGQWIQLGTWRSVVSAVVNASGGTAPDGVQSRTDSLDDEQAERIETWLRDLVVARERETALETPAPRPMPADAHAADAQTSAAGEHEHTTSDRDATPPAA